MGFEDYQVILSPLPNTRLSSGGTPELTRELACEVQQMWSALAPDEMEQFYQDYPLAPEAVFLAYETPSVLFQMKISLNKWQNNSVQFSLRFAYCNPRSVYEPFCQVVTEMMRRYDLVCHPMRDLAHADEGGPKDILSPADVRRVLIPSMDYNRRLWFLDAGTDEEAALRPGDAIARFILPRLTALPDTYAETI